MGIIEKLWLLQPLEASIGRLINKVVRKNVNLITYISRCVLYTYDIKSKEELFMTNHQQATQSQTALHPTIEFTRALDQLEEEHVTLRNKLQEFVMIEEVIRLGRPETDWFGTLRDLKVRVEAFLVELEHHAEWEDEALFPMFANLVADSPPLLDLIEEDHRLAMQYMEAFLDELHKSVSPIRQEKAKHIISLLMNAHQLILDHFYGEERYIFPLAEQMQTNIDYLSS